MHKKTINTVSFESKLNPNQKFWLKNKFKVHQKIKTTTWKNIIKEDIKLVCYTRKL